MKKIIKKFIIVVVAIINICYFYSNFNIYLKNDIYKIRYFLKNRYSFAWENYELNEPTGVAEIFGYTPEKKYKLYAHVQDGTYGITKDGVGAVNSYYKVDYKEEPNLHTTIYLTENVEINYKLSDLLKGKPNFSIDFIIYYNDYNQAYGSYNIISFYIKKDDKGYFVSEKNYDDEKYSFFYENIEPIQTEVKSELEERLNMSIEDIISIVDKVLEIILNDYKNAYKKVTIFKLVSYSIFILFQICIYYLIRRKYVNKKGY